MVKVLNAGYVELVEWMGGDKAVVRNARRCWQSEDRSTPEKDRKLIRMLLDKQHLTPFEAMVFTFDVKAPLFVARQWFRHRMGSFNEVSLRYCEANPEFYVPSGLSAPRADLWHKDMTRQFEAYKYFVVLGMEQEQARALLPTGLYTKWYWTVNGSSLLNFLRLRTDKAAQAEIREYALAIYSLVVGVAPVTFHEAGEGVLPLYHPTS